MKVDTSLRTVEPFEAVKRHPRAAAFGAVITAIPLGLMGMVSENPVVGLVMALIGACIGAPGAAHLVESTKPS
jgi:hypothetical protein